MVADDDDRTHYEVLGVDRRASKDKVREVYRERLSDTQADQIKALESKRPSDDEIQAARREVARVREAWQVLSDPVQRQRYDARLGDGATGEVDGELELSEPLDDDEDDDDAPVRSRTPARKARPRDANRPPGMFSSEPQPAPPGWPPGFTPPPPRARTMAMAIDSFVLLVLFIIAQVGGVQIIQAAYPKEQKQIDRIDALFDKATNCKDANSKRKNSSQCSAVRSRSVALLHDIGADKTLGERPSFSKLVDSMDSKRKDLQQKMLPAQFGLMGATFLVAMLYLVPSTVRSGRTLGKRLLQIRVVMEYGSPVTLRAALIHYGLPVGVALLFSPILGQLIFVVVLFGVLTWSRNPKRQALHDRIAHTIVVDG